MTENKIKTQSELKKILNSLRRRGKKIVFANGCFDIIHKGHVRLLEKAKSLGDILVVAINTDASVKKIKGDNRPVNTGLDRASVLAALEAVDYVTFFGESDPLETIKQLSPDILVKGGDWKKENIVGAGYVESKGGKVYSLPLLKGYSTSKFIEKLIG